MGEVMMDSGWEADTDHAELVAARQRLVGLDAEMQQLRRDMVQLERDKRDAARELEALRHTAQAPQAQQADKPPGADPRLAEITALLHALQQDISDLTRALHPVIVTFAQLQDARCERAAEDAPAPEVSRWQRLTCWWRGHEENVTDFTNERSEPYTRCVNCGRVYRR
jgi:chromosome segregation ATPase